MPRGGAWPKVRQSEKPRWWRVSDASRRDGSEAEGRADPRAGEPRIRCVGFHSAVQIRAPRVGPGDLALTRTKPPCPQRSVLVTRRDCPVPDCMGDGRWIVSRWWSVVDRRRWCIQVRSSECPSEDASTYDGRCDPRVTIPAAVSTMPSTTVVPMERRYATDYGCTPAGP